MCDHIDHCKECAYNSFIAEFAERHFDLDISQLDEEFEEMHPQFKLYCEDCEERNICNSCYQDFCLCNGTVYTCCNVTYCKNCIDGKSFSMKCKRCNITVCKQCYKRNNCKICNSL